MRVRQTGPVTQASIGYAAALEQFGPTEAIELAALAEQHGFVGTVASEGFQPFTPQQGQSPFVWNVVSALGARTTGPLGVGPVSPTFRWHPAMGAQAAATLAAMDPGRQWLALWPWTRTCSCLTSPQQDSTPLLRLESTS